MSYNELHEHKRSDTVKWIVAFTLIAILFVGMIGGYFVMTKNVELPKPDETVEETPAEENTEEPIVEAANAPIRLMSVVRTVNTENMALAAANEAKSTTSVQVTATVNPESSISDITWSLAFANPQSTWATGKKVSDYVSITYPNEENTRVVNVNCLQAFGEQITLTASAAMDPTKTASCTVDYYQRALSYNKTGSSMLFTGNTINTSNVYSFGTWVTAIDPRAGSVVPMGYARNLTYGVYSKANAGTVKLYVKASSSLANMYSAAREYVEIYDLSQYYLLSTLTGQTIYYQDDSSYKTQLNQANLNTVANRLRSLTGDFFTLKIEISYPNTPTETYYETFTLNKSSLPAGVNNVALNQSEINF